MTKSEADALAIAVAKFQFDHVFANFCDAIGELINRCESVASPSSEVTSQPNFKQRLVNWHNEKNGYKSRPSLAEEAAPQKCPDVCPRCGSDDRGEYRAMTNNLKLDCWSTPFCSEGKSHHPWHDAKPADLPDPLCSLCFGTGSWEGPGTVCKCVGRAKRPAESKKEK